MAFAYLWRRPFPVSRPRPMSLQGPILIIAATDKPPRGLVQALSSAGAFPVIEACWSEAQAALTEIKPAAIVASEPNADDFESAKALAHKLAGAAPIVPMVMRVGEDSVSSLPAVLTIVEDTPTEHLIARLAGLLRLRSLHATVLGRAQTLKAGRNVIVDMPDGDPLDDATVLLIGRGRHHATLSVAVGERMGVMGALSIDSAARCLTAREIDGDRDRRRPPARFRRRLPHGVVGGLAFSRSAGGPARSSAAATRCQIWSAHAIPPCCSIAPSPLDTAARLRDSAEAPAEVDRAQGHDRPADRAAQRRCLRP